MKIRGTLTEKEFAELRKMSRSWRNRLIWLWSPGAALSLLFLWMTVDALLHEEGAVVWKLALVWLIIGGVAVWASINHSREKRKALSNWNSRAPEFVVMTANGVSGEYGGKSGRPIPWTSFRSWREGGSVFLLRLLRGSRVQALPKADLTEQQIQELRGMLDLFIRPR